MNELQNYLRGEVGLPAGYSTPEQLEVSGWDKLNRSEKYQGLRKIFTLVEADCDRCFNKHNDNPRCSVALRNLQGVLDIIKIEIEDNKSSHLTPEDIYRRLLDLSVEFRAIEEKYSKIGNV